MAGQQSEMMDLAREWMDIQREYMMGSMKALTPTDGEAGGFESVYRRELDTTQKAVEKTLQLEERAVNELQRGAGDVPGMNGMVDMMSEFSRSALHMRSQLWQSWFEQMRAVREAVPSTPATGSRQSTKSQG
ncbi:hypothetical protein [Spiribacter insolitus]|uniref:Phasin domain-containing protein n=1 Tax=Spiribacter insolitus TaxID=3122417 RepID=A0ABV3T4N8_9GAMM